MKALTITAMVASVVIGDAYAQVVDTGNKVGIGINPPLEKLHVNGAIRGHAAGGAISIKTDHGYLDLGPMNTSWAHFQTDRAKYYFNKPVTVDGGISSYGANSLFLQTNDINRMTILNSNGYVGIGTTAPAGLLEIKGPYSGASQLIINTTASNAELKFSDNGVARGYVWFDKTTNTMAFGRGSNNNSLFVNSTGNVAIGAIPTSSKLEVVGPSTGSGPTIKASGGGDVVMNSGGSLFFDGNYSYASGNYIRPLAVNTQGFFTSGAERMRISPSGNVGIGTTSPNEKLTVNGTIYGKEVKVDLSVPGPDYVFEKDYDLPTLDEIKSYIDEHKHLPEVPSAKEMEGNGINVGEMNMILLKKVEELTLYMIELKGENTNAKKEIEILKNEISRLKEKK